MWENLELPLRRTEVGKQQTEDVRIAGRSVVLATICRGRLFAPMAPRSPSLGVETLNGSAVLGLEFFCTVLAEGEGYEALEDVDEDNTLNELLQLSLLPLPAQI